jgi:hypothetical protein
MAPCALPTIASSSGPAWPMPETDFGGANSLLKVGQHVRSQRYRESHPAQRHRAAAGARFCGDCPRHFHRIDCIVRKCFRIHQATTLVRISRRAAIISGGADPFAAPGQAAQPAADVRKDLLVSKKFSSMSAGPVPSDARGTQSGKPSS